MTTPEDKVFRVLNSIPKGKVTTYGGVAQMAGLGRAARYVGTTLRKLPKGSKLPWHRVINSAGKISFPPDHPGYERQKHRLQEEGVVVINGKVNLKDFLWEP